MEPQVGRPAAPSLWTGPPEDPRRYRVDLVDGAPVDVGGGGEGLVFQAHRVIAGDEHTVALKMHTALTLHDFAQFAGRARVLSEIGHPHVMHIVDAFIGTALIDDPHPTEDAFSIMYTVAEWIPGLSLPAAIEASTKGSGLRWVAQVARAVAYLHGLRTSGAPAGVVHRDIKPSNVRVTPDGEAVLIDFGIARPHQEGDHTEGAGTFLWRAPEVLGGAGDPGPASDAWGVGALAYWVLMGEPPRLEGAAAARELLAPAARSAGFVDPKGLGHRIAELLETLPQRRPSDLRRWADEMDVRAAGKRPFRPRRVAAIAAAVLVMAGGLTATAVALGRTTAPSPSRSQALAREAQAQMSKNVGLGGLLSLASYSMAPTRQARAAMVDAAEQPVSAVLQDGSPVTSIAYDGGGHLLAGGDSAGHVSVWNTNTGRRSDEFAMPSGVTSVALSPNGTLVAAGDAGGKVVVRGTSGRSTLHRSLPLRRRVTSVAFSPGGSVVVIGEQRTGNGSGPRGGKVIAWNPTTGVQAEKPVPHDLSPTGVAFDPQVAGLVTIVADRSWVGLWAAGTPTVHLLTDPHNGASTSSMSYSPDGGTLAVGLGDDVDLWNARTLETALQSPETTVTAGIPVTSVAVSTKGQEVATADAKGAIALWNSASPTKVTKVAEFSGTVPVNALAFSPDGATLAAAGASGSIVLWSTRPKEATLAPSDGGATIDSVASNRTGGLIATANSSGNVDLWNASGDSEIGQLPGDGVQVDSVALSGDGLRLATGDNKDSVAVWNTLNKKEVWHANVGAPAHIVAFSPDGDLLATAMAPSETVLWKTETNDIVRRFRDPHGSLTFSLAFSPDGRLLATGDEAGYVTVWNATTGTRVGPVLDVAPHHIVNSLAFAPDGSTLAAGGDDGDTTIWTVPTGGLVRRLSDHSRVLSVAFSNDGSTLVTGANDGRMVAWDVADGSEIAPPLRVGSHIWSLAFSTGGTTLAEAGDTAQATFVPSVVVTATTPILASDLCREMAGNLTVAQWNQYVPDALPYQKVCPSY